MQPRPERIEEARPTLPRLVCRPLQAERQQARGLAAEKLLTGSRGEVEKRLPQAADAIADAADLVDDHEGSAEYKRHLIQVFLRRVFRKALGEPIA